MPTIRVPLAEPLTNRDSGATKDSKLTNCFVQNVGGQEAVIKRPGTLLSNQYNTGQGSGSYCYNSALSAISGGVFSTTAKTPITPSLVGSLAIPYPQFLAVSNNTAFITDYFNNKIQAIDITNPSSPSLGGSYPTVTGPQVVLVSGNYLYIGGNQVQKMTLSGSIVATQTGVSILSAGLLVSDPYVYAVSGGGTFYVLNTSNLSIVGSCASGLTSNPTLTKKGNYVYAQGPSLVVYDVSSPSAPTIAATTVYDSSGGDSLIDSNSLYTVGSDKFLVVRDVSAPPSSPVLGSATLSGNAGGGIAKIGNMVYATIAAIGALRAFDVTNPAAIVSKGDTAITTPVYCEAQGDYIYVATHAATPMLYIYRVVDVVTTTSVVDSTTPEVYSFSPLSSVLVFKNNNAMYTRNTSTGVVTQVTSLNYPAHTVPGLVYIDGTFYVGTSDGTIYGSGINDPMTWSALNYISSEIEPDGLMAIAKNLNYLVAFGQWSTEFFYDAGNATGSPLSAVPNAFFKVGCASGESVVSTENTVIWMSRTFTRGRQISVLNGFTPEVISTPEIDRILNADDLATVYSFSIKVNGSTFYVLTLKTSAKTLVYDFSSRQWHFWTTMTAQAPKAITSLTYANGVVTVSQTAHGYADGDVVTIAGATPSGYNGNKNITYIDSNTYSYLSASVLSSPATGTITATGYTESYFNGVSYATCGGMDLIQGELDGAIYSVSPSYYNDNGTYINTKLRTVRIDGGDAKRKFTSKAEIIADKVAATALVRYTDDDYQTYCTYRPVDLSAKRSMILRLGHTRRRAYEIRVTDNQPLRFGALELDMEQGSS